MKTVFSAKNGISSNKGRKRDVSGGLVVNSVMISEDQANLLESNPEIVGVEEDKIITIDWKKHQFDDKDWLGQGNEYDKSARTSNLSKRADFTTSFNFTNDYSQWTQVKMAPWNLARLSMTDSAMITEYFPYGVSYYYPPPNLNNTGTVIAYVLDSGINENHAELAGKIVHNTSLVTTEDTQDLLGHGTFVASIIAGKTIGVSRVAKIASIKILDAKGDSTISKLISALGQAYELKKSTFSNYPGVVNLSLNSDGTSALIPMAINELRKLGVLTIISAGNNGKDACDYSPAGDPNGLTVGSTTPLNDGFASFSNYGTCVDILAPGSIIAGADSAVDAGITYSSGTSHSAPIVTGICTLVLQQNPGLSAKDLKSAILSSALKDMVQGVPPDTPNLLAWNGYNGNRMAINFS
ncbi:Subtilase-type proteinase psp3 [Zancudomyces culisetae]|uniref:Subtilase-type proteinase psp3 n=1 Tax=Zancudomyces culisetae TaxID=1213189 RepID=A0A1R1PW73_ZANCU|nr:Subtilase-type proteinase psp3 [Zancudomyces culisetae]|eukprot:OMH85163.1 Subtilase-type proteinase psp3 [Zancudomyces culisetae]